MGNMVNVSLLTDCWTDFEKDPERLLRAITAEGLHGEDRYPYGRDTMSGVQAHRYHHAGDFALYSQYHNLSVHLSKWDRRTEELARTSPHMREHLMGLIEKARFHLDQLQEMLGEIEAEAQDGT